MLDYARYSVGSDAHRHKCTHYIYIPIYSSLATSPSCVAHERYRTRVPHCNLSGHILMFTVIYLVQPSGRR